MSKDESLNDNDSHFIEIDFHEDIEIPAKYIFLDVVDFTKDRTVEAQSHIVRSLNSIVSASVGTFRLPTEKVIFIPTGDGICIALLGVETPIDIHLQIALLIIKGVSEHNKNTENEIRKFQVRIGVNSNIDNLIIDINGNKNVAGAGINTAARIMSVADGNQVFVGQTVYETLRHREKYSSSFKSYYPTVKHGMNISVYQYISDHHEGLNTGSPSFYKGTSQVEPKLTKAAAYYFANAIKIREFLLNKIVLGHGYESAIMIWLLTKESLTMSEAKTEAEKIYFETHQKRNYDLEKLFDEISHIKFEIQSALIEHIKEKYLGWHSGYFEGYDEYRFLTNEGVEKLKADFPDIWGDFGLEMYQR